MLPFHPALLNLSNCQQLLSSSFSAFWYILFISEGAHTLTGRQIQQILQRIGVKAGIGQRLSPHKFHHSFATFTLRPGGNLEHVRRMMGHQPGGQPGYFRRSPPDGQALYPGGHKKGVCPRSGYRGHTGHLQQGEEGRQAENKKRQRNR